MKRRLLCGAALSVAIASPALAQDQQGSTALDEVIVTAQKREEKVSDVPISITVVNAEVLAATSSNNLIQLQGVVPGILFQGDKSYGGSSVAIRGTAGNSSPLQDDPVPVYVDGVYQTSNNFTSGSVSDIGSIEIVRGPQGTLQGRNATAGALIVRTRDPEPEFGGFLKAGIADPLEYRIGGAVTGPITETLSGRFSLDYYHERGWLKNLRTDNWLGGQTAYNARAVLLWRPNEDFRARLMVNYQRNKSNQALVRWARSAINPSGQAVTAPTPGVPLSKAEEDRVLKDHEVSQLFDSGSLTRAPSLALELSYDFGAFSLVSISGANSTVIDGATDSGDIGLVDRVGFNIGQVATSNYSQEIRLQSNGGSKLSWLAGAYVSQSTGDFRFDIYNLRLSVPTDRVSMFTANQHNPSRALFADATYDITDQFAITGGVRYTRESKTFHNTFTLRAVPSGTILSGPLLFNPPKTTWEDTSYRVKAVYRPTSAAMLYVSYSKGFKSGGYNAFSAGPSPVYNPETLKSLELGVKTDFWERRGYVAASVYDNRYDNLQVSTGVPTGGVVITNAANAKITGFEIEGRLRPIDRLTLDANVAYIDATYKSFLNAPNINGVRVDASGKRLRATPEWQYFVQAAYEFDVSGDWVGEAQVNWRWRDKIYLTATDQTLPHLNGEALGGLGLRLSFENKASGLTAAIYGVNLTDEQGVTSQGLAFNYPSSAFNKPRVIGVELQKTF